MLWRGCQYRCPCEHRGGSLKRPCWGAAWWEKAQKQLSETEQAGRPEKAELEGLFFEE